MKPPHSAKPAGDEAASELRRYGVLASIHLCEAFHKVRRLEEELALLAKELAQYVHYYEEQVEDLHNTVSAVETGQRPLVEVLGAAGIESEQRYFCASAFQAAAGSAVLARFPQAVCALLRAGIAECSKLISLARRFVGEQADAPAAPMQEAAEMQRSDPSDDDSITSDDSGDGGV